MSDRVGGSEVVTGGHPHVEHAVHGSKPGKVRAIRAELHEGAVRVTKEDGARDQRYVMIMHRFSFLLRRDFFACRPFTTQMLSKKRH